MLNRLAVFALRAQAQFPRSEVDVLYSEASPVDNDVVICVRDAGLRLRFEPAGQRCVRLL